MKRVHLFILLFVGFASFFALQSCTKESQIAEINDTTAETRLGGCNGSLYTWCDGSGFLPAGVISVIGSQIVGNNCCVTFKTLPNAKVTLKVPNNNPAIVTPQVFNGVANGNGDITFCFKAPGTCMLLQMYYNGVLSCIELEHTCS